MNSNTMKRGSEMSAANLYGSVINDVIARIREGQCGEYVDEYVLQELKQMWERKLAASNVLDPQPPVSSHGLLDARMEASQMSQATTARPKPCEAPTSQSAENPADLVSVKVQIPAQPGIFLDTEARTLNIKVPKYVLKDIEPNTNFQRTNKLFHQILTGGIELAKDLPTKEAEIHIQGQIEQFFPLPLSANNNVV